MRSWIIGLALMLAVPAASAPSRPRYGHDPAAGATFVHDGVKLYYERYGAGPPLLLIHGNGGNIASMTAQIAHFRKNHRVIAMDSRDHGRSGDSPVPLTFEAMADDLAALLDHLHTGPVDVVGWSDGGIEALLLAQRHPALVRKIVSMAANIEPEGVVPGLLAGPDAPDAPPLTGTAARDHRVKVLDRDEPHIAPVSLGAITAPVLVMAGDHDLIRDEHTLLIFHSLPNAQLAILPDATHLVPYDEPLRFNPIIDHFLATPYVKKDRIGDVAKSIARMRRELGVTP